MEKKPLKRIKLDVFSNSKPSISDVEHLWPSKNPHAMEVEMGLYFKQWLEAHAHVTTPFITKNTPKYYLSCQLEIYKGKRRTNKETIWFKFEQSQEEDCNWAVFFTRTSLAPFDDVLTALGEAYDEWVENNIGDDPELTNDEFMAELGFEECDTFDEEDPQWILKKGDAILHVEESLAPENKDKPFELTVKEYPGKKSFNYSQISRQELSDRVSELLKNIPEHREPSKPEHKYSEILCYLQSLGFEPDDSSDDVEVDPIHMVNSVNEWVISVQQLKDDAFYQFKVTWVNDSDDDDYHWMVVNASIMETFIDNLFTSLTSDEPEVIEQGPGQGPADDIGTDEEMIAMAIDDDLHALGFKSEGNNRWSNTDAIRVHRNGRTGYIEILVPVNDSKTSYTPLLRWTNPSGAMYFLQGFLHTQGKVSDDRIANDDPIPGHTTKEYAMVITELAGLKSTKGKVEDHKREVNKAIHMLETAGASNITHSDSVIGSHLLTSLLYDIEN